MFRGWCSAWHRARVARELGARDDPFVGRKVSEPGHPTASAWLHQISARATDKVPLDPTAIQSTGASVLMPVLASVCGGGGGTCRSR